MPFRDGDWLKIECPYDTGQRSSVRMAEYVGVRSGIKDYRCQCSKPMFSRVCVKSVPVRGRRGRGCILPA